nr:uncharacterized protein LOC104088140 [Nicotiana tomentosiformis]
MKQMVNDFVVGCDICLRSKDDNMSYPGLLQPLLIPNQAWSHIIEVRARIGSVAYKLDLPPESKVYPVFHVSLLKKKVGDRVVVQTTLLITSDDGQFLVKPVAILQRQLIKRNNADVVRVLVQWSNLPPEDATWEDYQFLKAKFPDFDCNP